MNKLFYFGPCSAPLPIRIRLIESDEDSRKALDKIAGVTKLLSGAGVPGIPSVIGAGAGLVGALSRFIKGKIDDDEEAIYLGSLAELTDNQKIIYTLSNSKGPVLEVTLEIHDLGAPQKNVGAFRVSVTTPEIAYSVDKIRPEETDDDEGAGYMAGTPRDYTPTEYLRAYRRLERFNFEAGSGPLLQGISTRFKTLPDVLAWKELELFRVKVKRNDAGKYTIPLAYSFSLNAEETDAQALLDVANTTLAFAKTLGAETAKPEDFLTKHGQTALGFISEFAKSAVSLCAFDGVLMLVPHGESIPHGPTRGRLVIEADSDGKWKIPVAEDIQITVDGKKKRIGKFTFGLEIEAVSADR